ncbi:MAG TPA: hypothetical protein VL943_07860, partial [Niabella sp.]|nr:hypothetical protein [Niabella sp.]
TLVSIAGPVDCIPVGGRMIDFIVEANRQQLVGLATLVQEGKIKTNVGNIAAFDQAVAAFAPNVRLKGKTIIHIRS